jgi:hypothetical protein
MWIREDLWKLFIDFFPKETQEGTNSYSLTTKKINPGKSFSNNFEHQFVFLYMELINFKK